MNTWVMARGESERGRRRRRRTKAIRGIEEIASSAEVSVHFYSLANNSMGSDITSPLVPLSPCRRRSPPALPEPDSVEHGFLAPVASVDDEARELVHFSLLSLLRLTTFSFQYSIPGISPRASASTPQSIPMPSPHVCVLPEHSTPARACTSPLSSPPRIPSPSAPGLDVPLHSA